MMKKFLILFFVLFLSHLTYASDSQILSDITKQGISIRNELGVLLKEAKNPGTIGVGHVDLNELKSQVEPLENSLQGLRDQMASVINLYFSENGAEVEEEELFQKAKIITFYFTQLSTLIQLRFFLGKEFLITSTWLKKFSFPVTLKTIQELSGTDVLNLAMTQESPIIIEENLSSLRKLTFQDQVHLTLSPLHIHALEQVALTNGPDKDAYFTLVQYLLTKWLYDNQSEVNQYLGNDLMSQAEVQIPEELKQKLSSFSLIPAIEQSKKALEEEKVVRENIINHIPQNGFFIFQMTTL